MTFAERLIAIATALQDIVTLAPQAEAALTSLSAFLDSLESTGT